MVQPAAYAQIHSLASFLRQRKEAGEPPYILVLGAGASLGSGVSSTAHIVEAVVGDHTGQDPATLTWEEKLASFYTVLDGVSAQERYLILSRHLQGAEPSSGYLHLAALVKAGYFDRILTTNFDLFLENALLDAGLHAHEFAVLVNGQAQEEQIIQALRFARPVVKIVKLHGDLNARLFAFTPEEVFQFTDRIERTLTDMLSGDILVVGHSLRDDDLNRCIRAVGGALWYVNPSEPSPGDFTGRAVRARGTPGHIVSSELGKFDPFFAWLRLEVLLPPPVQAAGPEERRLLGDLDGRRKGSNGPGMAAALEGLAGLYSQAGDSERAAICYEQSVALLEGSGNPREAARVAATLGTFHARLNRPEPALRWYRRSSDLSQVADDPQGMAHSLAMLGQVWRAAGKPDKAVPYWEQALALAGGLSDAERDRVSRWLREA